MGAAARSFDLGAAPFRFIHKIVHGKKLVTCLNLVIK